ncbi:MAG: hypothetical protein WCT04_16400 [Planctomycetota bacterium]
MSEKSQSGYCVTCQRQQIASSAARCTHCGRLIWELMAKPCDLKNPLRTTRADYAALIRFSK